MNAGKCQRPYCHGDLFITYDNGWLAECILCERTRDLTPEELSKMGLSQRREIAPYTQSPSECRCTAFNTIPVFAHSKMGFRP